MSNNVNAGFCNPVEMDRARHSFEYLDTGLPQVSQQWWTEQMTTHGKALQDSHLQNLWRVDHSDSAVEIGLFKSSANLEQLPLCSPADVRQDLLLPSRVTAIRLDCQGMEKQILIHGMNGEIVLLRRVVTVGTGLDTDGVTSIWHLQGVYRIERGGLSYNLANPPLLAMHQEYLQIQAMLQTIERAEASMQEMLKATGLHSPGVRSIILSYEGTGAKSRKEEREVIRSHVPPKISFEPLTLEEAAQKSGNPEKPTFASDARLPPAAPKPKGLWESAKRWLGFGG